MLSGGWNGLVVERWTFLAYGLHTNRESSHAQQSKCICAGDADYLVFI